MSALNKIATPSAYPDSGLYDVTHLITLTCATPGAKIYYTVVQSSYACLNLCHA
jgi:hypothetical protein